jgi:hypothetical protein
MLFGRKGKVQVDVGDVASEKEHLTQFLKTTHKITVTPIQNKLAVDDEKVTPQELQHLVTKFIYKRNLNATHYVEVAGNTVKIITFKGVTKKAEKPKKGAAHQTSAQSWGL